MKTKMSKRYGGLLDKTVEKGRILSELHREIGQALDEIMKARAERAVWQVVFAQHPELEQEFIDELRLFAHCASKQIPYPPEGDVQIDELVGSRDDRGDLETSETEGQDDDGESSPAADAQPESAPTDPEAPRQP